MALISPSFRSTQQQNPAQAGKGLIGRLKGGHAATTQPTDAVPADGTPTKIPSAPPSTGTPSGPGLASRLKATRVSTAVEDDAPATGHHPGITKDLAEKLYAAQSAGEKRRKIDEDMEEGERKRREFKPETGRYPAQSNISEDIWAEHDIEGQLVCEIRDAKTGQSSLLVTPRKDMNENNLIAQIFDRTIIVVGSKSYYEPPEGYKSIRIRSNRTGGSAHMMIPESREGWFALCDSGQESEISFGKLPESERKKSGPSPL